MEPYVIASLRVYADWQDGSIDIAVDAIKAAGSGHTFLSVTKQGLSAIVETSGNNSTHVILRGSSKGPNYEAEHVEACSEKLKKAGLIPKIMASTAMLGTSTQGLIARSTARMEIRPSSSSDKLSSVKTSYVGRNPVVDALTSRLSNSLPDLPVPTSWVS